MPAFTPNRAYPYSIPGDPADVPQALQDLAEAIDDDICTLANIESRPVARFRGTGTYASQTPAFPLVPAPFPSFPRVPFDLEEFDLIGCTMQSQEVGNRLILPNAPGFYFAVATVYVPPLTVSGAVVNFMDVQIRVGDASNPLNQAARLGGDSGNVPVTADDRGVRVMSVSGASFMNGTTDAFCVEWRADTTPDVAEYVINERTLTILRMTQS